MALLHLPRFRRTLFATAIVALPGCGSAPPPQAAPPVPAATTDAKAPEAPISAAPPAEAAACLDLAGAKRVKRTPEPEAVTIKHVLVKYKGSKRAEAGVTRTREQACLRALEARDKVRGGADFEAVVREYSDEPGAATRGGLVGAVHRAEVEPPFADAAFELEPNQLSDVVETEFGFHVLLRTQ
jgi:peptidyl-prolyl cis-trans isomerase NIMA-interacting 1